MPNWHIFSIPIWYNLVKQIMKKTRIKELREQRKLTQVKLAFELGLTQTALSRYETDERDIDCDTLKKIADYFDVSIDYLLRETDNPARNK